MADRLKSQELPIAAAYEAGEARGCILTIWSYYVSFVERTIEFWEKLGVLDLNLIFIII